MDRTDPIYTAEVVKMKPRRDDQREVAIAEKIGESVLRESWARNAFEKARLTQIAYMKDLLPLAGNQEAVRSRTREVIEELSALLKSEIVEGAEFLKDLPKGSPALIMTNHFGAYKLVGIDPKEELGVDIPGYDFMYPSPMYFAQLKPVANAIGNDLSYVSNDFPGVFGQLHTDAGFVHVPAVVEGKTAYLEQETRELMQQHPATALVNFPEGGTSGKYTGLGPYALDPYKTGGYVIASKLGIPVIPVAQYFDSQKGFQLKVLKPYIPQQGERSTYEGYARQDQTQMQEWFDTKTGT
jgi:hypothetical protein